MMVYRNLMNQWCGCYKYPQMCVMPAVLAQLENMERHFIQSPAPTLHTTYQVAPPPSADDEEPEAELRERTSTTSPVPKSAKKNHKTKHQTGSQDEDEMVNRILI